MRAFVVSVVLIKLRHCGHLALSSCQRSVLNITCYTLACIQVHPDREQYYTLACIQVHPDREQYYTKSTSTPHTRVADYNESVA